mgnify:CR=1 FL=1
MHRVSRARQKFVMNYENFYCNGQQFFAHNKYQFWFLIHNFAKLTENKKNKPDLNLKDLFLFVVQNLTLGSGHNAK